MHEFVDAFKFIGNNADLLWHLTLHTLGLFAVSFGLALVISLPLGVWLGHIHRGAFLAINVSNLGRALPSVALIAIFLTIFGIGFWNVAVALIVLAVPVIITNAFVAIDGVDRDIVQAARGVGMSPLQVLLHVELPLSVPLLFAGIRTAALYVMATTPLASTTGGTGLGDVIVNKASYGTSGVIAAMLCVTALAFLAEGLLALLQRALTPRPLRGRGEAFAVGNLEPT